MTEQETVKKLIPEIKKVKYEDLEKSKLE